LAVDSSGAADLENTSEPRLGVKGGRGSGASGQDLADLAQQMLGEFPTLRVVHLEASAVLIGLEASTGIPNPEDEQALVRVPRGEERREAPGDCGDHEDRPYL
jgi:hypothetical protein